MRHAAAVALCLSLPAAAAAGPFPTRGGESGLLDVPDAEVMGRGEGRVGGEIRFDRVPGTPDGFGPLPLSLVSGLGGGLEAGVTMREWGQPGDPRPAPLLFGAALKLRLLGAEGSRHAVAVDATVDRFNWKAISGMRLIASTAEVGRLRLAGFLGAEARGSRVDSLGGTAGLAVSILHRSRTEAVLEALTGPRGSMFGAALRWSLTPRSGVSIGVAWLPGDDGFRASLGFGMGTPPVAKKDALPSSPAAQDVTHEEEATPAAPVFLDERPRFRLRIRTVQPPGETGPRHLQHAPPGPEATRGSPPPAPQPKPAPPPRDEPREHAAVREPQLAAEKERTAPVAEHDRERRAGDADAERATSSSSDARQELGPKPPPAQKPDRPAVRKEAPGEAARVRETPRKLGPKVALAAKPQRPPVRKGSSAATGEPAREPARRRRGGTGMVAAARAFYFPAPGLRLKGPGKKALQDIADFAARRRCKLLVWARTRDPDLIPEAERLSEELLRLAAAGPLPRERIAKRVTIRPTVAGVEVIVSAHCEQPGTAGSAGAAR